MAKTTTKIEYRSGHQFRYMSGNSWYTTMVYGAESMAQARQALYNWLGEQPKFLSGGYGLYPVSDDCIEV
jgi:hypothetical protein